eukprot:gene11643-13595_t
MARLEIILALEVEVVNKEGNVLSDSPWSDGGTRRTFTAQDLIDSLQSPFCCLKRLRSLTVYRVMDAEDIELLRAHQSLSIQLYLDRKDDASLLHCLERLQLESLSIHYGIKDSYDLYDYHPEKNTTDTGRLLQSSLTLRDLNLSNSTVPAVLGVHLGHTLTSLTLAMNSKLYSAHSSTPQHCSSRSNAQDYQPSFFDYMAHNNTLTSLSLAFIGNRSYLELISDKTNIKRLRIEMNDGLHSHQTIDDRKHNRILHLIVHSSVKTSNLSHSGGHRRTFTIQDLVQHLQSPYCCLKRLRRLIIYNVEDKKDIELLRAHHSLFFQHLEHLEWYADDYLTLSFFKEMVVAQPNAPQSIRSLQLLRLDHKNDTTLRHCLQRLQLESLSINYPDVQTWNPNIQLDIPVLLRSSLTLRELNLSNVIVSDTLGRHLSSLSLGMGDGSEELCHLVGSDAALFQSLQAIESLSHLSLFPSNITQDYQPFFDYLAHNNTLTSLSLPFIGNRSYLELIANKTNIKRLRIEMNDDIVFPHVRSLRLSATEDLYIYQQLCAIKRQHDNGGYLELQHLHLEFKQWYYIHAGQMIYNLPSFCQSLASSLKWLTIQSSFLEVHEGLLSGFARINNGLEVLEMISTEDTREWNYSFLQSDFDSKRLLDQIQLTPSSSIKQFILSCKQTPTTLQSCYIPRISSHGLYLTSSSMTPSWITLKYAFDECQVPMATTNNTLGNDNHQPTNDNTNYWNGDELFDDNGLTPNAQELSDQTTMYMD